MGASVPGAATTDGGAMGALLDVVKVLFEPGAVFERVRQKPRFLMPFLAIVVVQTILGVINLPYTKIALTAQMAARGGAQAGGPNPADFAWIGLIFVPIVFALIFLLSAFILWVLVSLVGGDGKFGTLLSVTTYASVPAVILLGIVSVVVIHIQGPGNLTSPADLQAALGLDLILSGSKGFVGAIAKGINPFSIWGLVLTALGVSTTHGLSKGSGYTVAISSFVFGLLIGGSLAAVFGG
jgi:membrane protein, antimicrobial resistance system